MRTATRESKESNSCNGVKTRQLRRSSSEIFGMSRRSTMESSKVEGRKKPATRLSTGTIVNRSSAEDHRVERSEKSGSRIGPKPSSRDSSFERPNPIERRGSYGRTGGPAPLENKRSLNSTGDVTSPAPCNTPSHATRRVGRSTSVVSTYSTASTYDSRMGDAENYSAGEISDLKKRLQESTNQVDGLKVELQIKKEEVGQLKDKVMMLSRELSEVSTTKGVLNEAFVSKMMDVLTLNAKISELEETKALAERQSQQLRLDAADYNAERCKLLDLLDSTSVQLQEYEEALEMERTRKKEIEVNFSSTVDRLGVELKFLRRELHEKTLKLKKSAQINTKLACKLLTVEADSAKANDLAQELQSQNSQLEGDNEELAGFVLQLEGRIDHMATERTLAPAECGDARTHQLARYEEDRAHMLNMILSLEEGIEQTRKGMAEGEDLESKLDSFRQAKSELQNDANALTESIGILKEKQNMERKEEERMKEDHVFRLEEDLKLANLRIEELNKTLKGARVTETEKKSSHQKASEQILKLESERASLQQNLVSMQSRVKAAEQEMHRCASKIKQEKDKEIQALQAEFNDSKKKLSTQEKRFSDYHRSKQDSENAIRKMKQEIEEHEQQKESMAYQVNVLEWQLVALYSDKEDAMRSADQKTTELARIQQELANKSDDLEQLQSELAADNEARIELCELHFAKEHLTDALSDAQRHVKTLEYELEQYKKEKTIIGDDFVKDQKKRRPWFASRISFSF